MYLPEDCWKIVKDFTLDYKKVHYLNMKKIFEEWLRGDHEHSIGYPEHNVLNRIYHNTQVKKKIINIMTLFPNKPKILGTTPSSRWGYRHELDINDIVFNQKNNEKYIKGNITTAVEYLHSLSGRYFEENEIGDYAYTRERRDITYCPSCANTFVFKDGTYCGYHIDNYMELQSNSDTVFEFPMCIKNFAEQEEDEKARLRDEE